MSLPVGGPTASQHIAVRRCALAVSVLFDLEIRPADDGIVLPGMPEIFVSDDDLARAIADADPETELARRRLRLWLFVRRAVAERSLDELAETLRPMGLPVNHELHPGETWVRQHVLGGFLDLGVGFVGLDSTNRERVVVAPQSVLDSTGVDPTPWWRAAVEYLENMGALATTRWRRTPSVAVRPMGDCDVVTLLASEVFRGALCADAGGMRPIAVPVRHRGWLDLSRIDPAFVQAAALIADDEERGFPRPVLLTIDEVTVALPGGKPAEIVLRDAAPENQRWLRDVLYH